MRVSDRSERQPWGEGRPGLGGGVGEAIWKADPQGHLTQTPAEATQQTQPGRGLHFSGAPAAARLSSRGAGRRNQARLRGMSEARCRSQFRLNWELLCFSELCPDLMPARSPDNSGTRKRLRRSDLRHAGMAEGRVDSSSRGTLQ